MISYPLENERTLRYIRLTGYHRFIYRFSSSNKELYIKKVMFHFDDDPPSILESDTQLEEAIKDCLHIMFDMCYDVARKFRNRMDKIPNYFNKVF
jgi:hypothetical protein